MNIFMLGAFAALAAAGLILLYVHKTLTARSGKESAVEQCLVLSVEKYRPMERLLREDDFRFLASQPGFSPQLGRRFRAERRRIFRGYLRHLKTDFGRVSLALRTLIVHSAEDRGDLAAAVVRQRLWFAFGMLAVEGRLFLHTAGLATVDVHGFIESMEQMQGQVRLLLGSPQTATASL